MAAAVGAMAESSKRPRGMLEHERFVVRQRRLERGQVVRIEVSLS